MISPQNNDIPKNLYVHSQYHTFSKVLYYFVREKQKLLMIIALKLGRRHEGIRRIRLYLKVPGESYLLQHLLDTWA